MISYFDNRLCFDSHTQKYFYYADLNKKWKFYTDKFGFFLLKNCSQKAKKILKFLKNKYSINTDLGKNIYFRKSNLKKTGITWTEKEYKNHSFRYVYTKIKLFQRFTETWSLFEEFSKYNVTLPETKLNIASIGCGPGFELMAADLFFKDTKHKKLYGLDSINEWKEIFEKNGNNYRFCNIDIFSNKFEKFLSNKTIDIILLSNIYANYMTNETGSKIIQKILENCKYILINDRSKNLTKYIQDLKKNGIFTYFLIEPSDHRQILLSKQKLKLHHLQKRTRAKTFPNVPFRE